MNKKGSDQFLWLLLETSISHFDLATSLSSSYSAGFPIDLVIGRAALVVALFGYRRSVDMARKMLINGELDKVGQEDKQYDFDLFAIGAGCGGDLAALTSVSFGAKDSRNFGWGINGEINFNWKKLLHNKTQEVIRLSEKYKQLLPNAGVTMIEGEGKLTDAHTVEVTEPDGTTKKYSAKHILIATGSRAQLVDIPGKQLAITSDEALSLEELPKRVVILGGGYIAVEFASIWQGMGVEVDLFYRKELPLRGFDDEMRAVVAKNLEGRGMRLHPGTNLTELRKSEDGISASTDHGDEFTADVVLFATGRVPNTKRLNLQSVGVELDETGAIKVDEYSRTSVPSIWAVGDVTNRMNLTPVAFMQGIYFSKTVFGGKPTKPDYVNIPCAVFCEQQALEQAKNDVLVYTSSFDPMKNTISGKQEKTVMKLIVDSETDKVLGASMCGPDAPEIMQVGIHPSAAEEFVTMRSLRRRVAGCWN
ncbi:hypothetical protein ZIOFF_042217 [Zingiber officinale]|uniref:glutathione-disulfide reductase n=1 Tax=Zingiber officinale TaxID=94328 RepID=A0A8J5G912_ZINOF|nr:hypothetical protein ZIOFF_042217 [Zingiber officinale]